MCGSIARESWVSLVVAAVVLVTALTPTTGALAVAKGLGMVGCTPFRSGNGSGPNGLARFPPYQRKALVP